VRARAPQNSGKIIFQAIIMQNSGTFQQKSQKIPHFVNFGGKYHKKSGILTIFWARIM